jgi:hypothetical protein
MEAQTRECLLHRHCDVLDDVFQHLIRLFRFFQRRSVEAVHHYTVGEYGNYQRLEIFGSAEAAAFQKGHGLRSA